MPATNIKKHIRGDSRNIIVQVLESDRVTPFNLTGCEVFFTLSADNSPTTDSLAEIELDNINNPAQVLITQPISGLLSIKLISDNTQNLEPGIYYYDVQIKDTFGNIISQPQAKFSIVADISRRTV